METQALPTINLILCDRCGRCIKGCPEDALRMTANGPQFNIPITCTYCTLCEDLCPTGAIRAPYQVNWAPDA